MSEYPDSPVREGLKGTREKPSSAGVYDYLLGGHRNRQVDRAFAKRRIEDLPDAIHIARANRAFTGRAVRHALAAGITQFVDIGSGLPSRGQAHEIADAVAPDSGVRVVYVDNESKVQANPDLLLGRDADPSRHRAAVADFHDFKDLWDKVEQTGVIRTGEPTCLIVAAVLHHLAPETEPEATMAFYRKQLAPGSHLALTHATGGRPEFDRAVAHAANPIRLRGPDEFAKFFGDWMLVKPGLCWTVQWRPDGDEHHWWGDEPTRSGLLAGVAIKPITLG